MMRDRFRFRAWDTHNNKYIYDAEMTYDDIGIRAECFGYMVDDYSNYEYIVEQCTGLKDKNGKLIYEGDIVAFYNRKGEISSLSVAEWGEFASDDYGLGVYGWTLGCYMDIYDTDIYVVVGNIHENPELIDEYKKNTQS